MKNLPPCEIKKPKIVRRLQHAYDNGQIELMEKIFEAHKKKCESPYARMIVNISTSGKETIEIFEF